jgi:hypothetical protein
LPLNQNLHDAGAKGAIANRHELTKPEVPPDINSDDARTPFGRLLKRRTGLKSKANGFALSFCAVTEDVWTSCILRKTLAGCAPGCEIYKLVRG